MQSLRQPVPIHPHVSNASGSNSNRDTKLLETRVTHTKQKTAHSSNRDKMHVLRPPQTARFSNSLVVEGLASSSVLRDPQLLETRATHTKQSISFFLIDNFCALFAFHTTEEHLS